MDPVVGNLAAQRDFGMELDLVSKVLQTGGSSSHCTTALEMEKHYAQRTRCRPALAHGTSALHLAATRPKVQRSPYDREDPIVIARLDVHKAGGMGQPTGRAWPPTSFPC